MPAPAMKVKYFLTDINNLNRIYREAKAVLIQPDSFHRALLQAAIDIAEKDEGVNEVNRWIREGQ